VLPGGVCYNIGVKASSISGYYAHADQQSLLNFVTRMDEWSSETQIVHGDAAAKNALAARYQAQYR
jgi:metallo-beta-lactamase family protein